MCERGWPLVAGIPETGEEYLCELLDHSARGHDPAPDPIVRVLTVLRYPRQRAIMQPEIAHEIAPLTAGTICRLPALRAARSAECACWLDGRPCDGLSAALTEAIREAGSERELEILLRHRQGMFHHTRRVVVFREWEWPRIYCDGGNSLEYDGFRGKNIGAE